MIQCGFIVRLIMKVTLHQLEVFSEVVKHKSITKASQALHMTQPGVTIQIKELEKRYGAQLIEIIGKKLYLTERGRWLHSAYQDIAQKLKDIETYFTEESGELKGAFNICIVSTAQYFIPYFLGQFHELNPLVDIKLTVTNRQTAIERLKNNQDDLVILSQKPDNIVVNSELVLEDQLVMIAQSPHPLKKEKDIHLKNLDQEKFLLREVGSGTRMAMEKIFKRYKINPKIIMELGSGEAIKQAVIAGMGISLVSRMSIEQELKLKKLIILPVSELPAKHAWYAVSLKQKKLSRIASEFLEFIAKTDNSTHLK